VNIVTFSTAGDEVFFDPSNKVQTSEAHKELSDEGAHILIVTSQLDIHTSSEKLERSFPVAIDDHLESCRNFLSDAHIKTNADTLILSQRPDLDASPFALVVKHTGM